MLTQTFHFKGLLTTGEINKNTSPPHSSKNYLNRGDFTESQVSAKCTMRLRESFARAIGLQVLHPSVTLRTLL